jgi:hypothetical protein
MEKLTFESIMGDLNKMAENAQTIDAERWVRASQLLNLFLEEEQNKLFKLEQEVAQVRVELINGGDTVAKAKVKVEASDIYREARSQKAKIERAIELVRISKLQARLSTDIYNTN